MIEHRAGADHLGLDHLALGEHGPAHAVRGEVEAAFTWLERAYVQGDGGITQSRYSRTLRSLHDDPRWKPFLKQGSEDFTMADLVAFTA